MNRNTMESLRTFQRDMGVSESGRVDAQTLEAMGFCMASSTESVGSDCVEFPTDRRGRLRTVQRILAERGYDPGSLNGQMGRKTREALKRFQSDNGLPGTGEADAATRVALGSCDQAEVATEPASTSQQAPVSDPQLQEAQQLLAGRGYDPGTADGLMGKKTREALKRFQTDNGLLVSGKADAQTLGVLRSSPATEATPEKTSLGPGQAAPSASFHKESLPAPPSNKLSGSAKDIALPPPPSAPPAASSSDKGTLALPPPPPSATPVPPSNDAGGLGLPPPPSGGN